MTSSYLYTDFKKIKNYLHRVGSMMMDATSAAVTYVATLLCYMLRDQQLAISKDRLGS